MPPLEADASDDGRVGRKALSDDAESATVQAGLMASARERSTVAENVARPARARSAQKLSKTIVKFVRSAIRAHETP